MGRLTDAEPPEDATTLRRRAEARAKLEAECRLPNIEVSFVSGRATDAGFVRNEAPAEVCVAYVGNETIRRREAESEQQFKTRVLGMQPVGRPSVVVWSADLPLAPNVSIRTPLPEVA